MHVYTKLQAMQLGTKYEVEKKEGDLIHSLISMEAKDKDERYEGTKGDQMVRKDKTRTDKTNPRYEDMGSKIYTVQSERAIVTITMTGESKSDLIRFTPLDMRSCASRRGVGGRGRVRSPVGGFRPGFLLRLVGFSW
jgi:hypothetical protein